VLNLLALETFTPHLGSTFRVTLAGGVVVDLILTEATSLGTSPGLRPDGTDRRAPFSLFFSGPIQPVLPQRIYYLEHPSVAGLDIFIVPLGPHEDGVRYQAIFS